MTTDVSFGQSSGRGGLLSAWWHKPEDGGLGLSVEVRLKKSLDMSFIFLGKGLNS